MLKRTGLLFAAGALALAAPALAQAPKKPAAGPQKSAGKPQQDPEKTQKAKRERQPITFYVAKGPADACGAGCDTWIAAEGYFNPGAAQRFRTVLKAQGQRKLPVYFYSSGGLAKEAFTIGRLLRERELSAGVARTLPAGCLLTGEDDAACRSLKRSGKPAEAELIPMGAHCNSACVIALVGAKVRHVPPGVRLAVHSSRFVQIRPDGSLKDPVHSSSSSAGKARAASHQAEQRQYFVQMGIDGGVLDIAFKTPHEQSYVLSRDELARFRIDERGFHETRWMLIELPLQPIAVFKYFVEARVEARDGGRNEFRTSGIRLACLPVKNVPMITATYLRGSGSWEAYMRGTGSAVRPAAIDLVVGTSKLALSTNPSISRIDALESGGSFDTRFGYSHFHFLEAAAAATHLEIKESFNGGPSRVVRVSTAGLSEAASALRKKCQIAAPPPVVGGPGVPGEGSPEPAKSSQ